MRSSRTLRGRLVWLLAGVAMAVGLTTSCSPTWDVEQRETPVHVWLTAPELARSGGTLDALIYVGPYKVVQGPVQFAQGGPTVNLPTLFIRAGNREVSAVIDRGRASTKSTVGIEKESWIQITVRGNTVSIRKTEEQPSPWGGR